MKSFSSTLFAWPGGRQMRRISIGTTPPGGKPSRVPNLRDLSVYLALVLLIIFDLVLTPGFRNPFVVRSLLFEAAPVVLIALGQSLAIGTRGIDLSVGSIMALSSAIIGISLGFGQNVGIAGAIFGGLACGLLNGIFIAIFRIAPLISSLALLVAARGLAQALLSGARVDLPMDGPLSALGQITIMGVPVVAIVALAVAAAFAFLVRRTLPGQYAIFVGASREASVLAGHPVRATLIFVYGLSGLLAGIAGVFASARLGAADANYIGVQFELDAVAAAVIGGTPLSGGRIAVAGTVAGVLLLTILDATFIMNNVNANFAQILKAAFIVGALYMQRGRA
ncbi:ABC transporter permease [Tanticharoenia sakaeratensis]|uniref:ABC sugar transporter, inner membrane subunit n=1 Tax=Tanticharoenia sakaeratensis NBRC 103193 TaxID=1231623 RepID=A0A0D6MLB4_9PROT|nr:ABC transporter permease [Tanticharoenia sakaeratensis]GAN54442.1 ABC sugar transporter, inner membrane subunit [Tanticharoenia sakaeratensis NBRC 103193]GBQ24136.1 sugar ABC transporter permease [Tanticharoenia sakaeratensis NBRC 103193]